MFTHYIGVRISDEEKAVLQPLLEKRSMSEVIRQLIRERAQKQKAQAQPAFFALSSPADEQKSLN